MKKRMQKVLALMLSLAMLVSVAACGKKADEESKQPDNEKQTETQEGNEVDSEAADEETEASEYPEYLNMDAPYPILKDEYADEIKLKVAIVSGTLTGDWDDLWVSKYLKEKYNLEFEVEYIPDTALDDRKSLMFNSGELPDIMLGFKLSTAEIMKYGAEGEMLLDCTPYINETLTPGLTAWFEDDTVRSTATTPDGGIYTLPLISRKDDPGAIARLCINTAWLEQLGLEVPSTLDEFTEVLYALKEADPGNVGELMHPLGGSAESNSPGCFLLSAFGYVITDGFNWDNGYGTLPTLRNGEVVIPAYDMEVFQEYLKLMNQYYQDGIINKDYFTMGDTEVTSQVTMDQTATFTNAIYITGETEFQDWEFLTPLTSEWNDTPVVGQPAYVNVGNFAISADTEYPELCMRFGDIYYNYLTDDPRALWTGAGGEYQWDYYHAEVDPETGNEYWDETKLEGMDLWTYLMARLSGFAPQYGALDTEEAIKVHFPDSDLNVFDLETGEGCYRSSVVENVSDYRTEAFPKVYYLDEETSARVIELETVLHPYIEEQVALFIVGERPLSETGDFVKELENMGIEELLDIWKEVYAAF